MLPNQPRLTILLASVISVLGVGGLFAQEKSLGPSAIRPSAVVSAPSRPDGLLPNNILAWDSLTKETNITSADGKARFTFSLTNISSSTVTIKDVQPSCGCTTAQLPPTPWGIPASAKGQISFTVNILGKSRNQLKTALVETDRGWQMLSLKINVLPPLLPAQSKADWTRSLKIAQANRQAIFQADCAACHVKLGEGKDGKALYYAVCAICHEGNGLPTPAPDLFAISTPTNVVFWLDWITHGKAGTLMPAFSKVEGGPLTEMQIANLARFLNTTDNMDPVEK